MRPNGLTGRKGIPIETIFEIDRRKREGEKIEDLCREFNMSTSNYHNRIKNHDKRQRKKREEKLKAAKSKSVGHEAHTIHDVVNSALENIKKLSVQVQELGAKVSEQEKTIVKLVMKSL